MATNEQILAEVHLLAKYMYRGIVSNPEALEGLLPKAWVRIQQVGVGVGQTLTALGRIEKQVSETSDLLSAVNEQTLGRIEAAVGAVDSNLAQLRQAVGDLRQEVAGLQAKVDNLQVDSDKNLGSLPELHSKVDDIKRTSADSVTSLAALDAKVESIKKDVASLPH